jgi:response regulator RpfG family c-di-GMP phosphodiesterase
LKFSVKTTSIAVALLTVMFLSAQAWLGLSRLASVHDATRDLVGNRFASSELLGQIDSETVRYRLRVTRYVLATDPDQIADIERQITTSTIRIAELLSRYEVRVAAEADRSKWEAFRVAWGAAVVENHTIVDLVRAGDHAAAAARVEASRDVLLTATAALRTEVARNAAIAEAEAAAASRTYADAWLDVFLLGALTVMTGIGIAGFFILRVSRPLADLTESMRAVTDGKWDTAVPATERSDEIGEMARALVYFRDRLAENERMRAEQAELDAANLRVIAPAQQAELSALDEAREVIAELAETLDVQVEEKTRHLVEREREIVWRLSRATERRDNDTGAHIVRMGKISGILAEALGLPQSDCSKIEIAAQMHDVGKVGIPDEILFKPGRLTPEERKVMETHALLGWDILKGSESRLIQLAAEVALTHHEKWDGTGYPHGLAGEQIPLVGRVAALADVFDALMAIRPYKQAWPLDRALDFVRENAGSHFDPACVEAFFERLPDILGVISDYVDIDSDGESRVA